MPGDCCWYRRLLVTLAAVLGATWWALWLAAAAICSFLLELCKLLLWLLLPVLLDASLLS